MEEDTGAPKIEELLATPALVDALENDRFRQFLDHVPVAIAVSELHPSENITYCNLEFERLTGLPAAEIAGTNWSALPGVAAPRHDDTLLSDAVQAGEEYLGTFTIERDGESFNVDAWSNTIENDEGTPIYRLVALAGSGAETRSADERHAQQLRSKDELLLELQHRVKNNLQMITALIRMEARNLGDSEAGSRFDNLAGRISSLAILYDLLDGRGAGDAVDLGVYLSQIASSVMQAHAQEGVRLELKVDTWPVSINVAMPAGLVVNELMTNALKHAFVGRDGGIIALSSLVDEAGCHVVISDDGVGLPADAIWPKPGKLSAVIVRSLQNNAKAKIDVSSAPDGGMRVTIFFAREAAAPEAQI
ncbi:sensor histidine kinase [Glacieibacterium frigidum]|uniref:sensor histidine kinase n=1 Tax=Glacieibacterium frigidum TaxID=2593303 RepID=UPI001F433AB4|nr:histidine kinase dimerization/phosphoacceptor domain -containing protein [Glacieibacterium frigidum]